MKSKEEQKYFVFFLAGFLLGVLYIYFSGEYKAEGMDFFSAQNLIQLQYKEIKYEEYFWYLVKKRTGILLILGVLSLAVAGKYLLFGFLMLFGCSMGSMLSVLIIRYGMRGILLFAGFIVPQDLVYLPAVFGWVTMLMQWNEGIFEQVSVMYRRRGTRYDYLKRFLLLSGVTIIGILLECYVNPVIVKFCLKIF